jgi:membrane associated rhomboid family serine protease
VFPLHDENPTSRRAWATILLIALNVGVYFLWQPRTGETFQAQQDSLEFTYEHAAIPCEVTTGEPLRPEQVRFGCDADAGSREIFPHKSVWFAIVVSMFLHGGLLHLGGNMLFLWVFGNNAEDRLGPWRYLLFYLLAGVVATLAHVVLQPDSTVPLVGASGAVAGVMGAYLVWFPNARVFTAFFFVIVFFQRIRAKWLLIFWFLSQFVVNPNSGVAWAAHVGGFVAGMAVALATRAFGRRPPARPAWT